MSGWFAVKRGTLEHELFAPEGKWSRYEAWVWFIETAAFKPTVIDIGGKPYTVPRGALCFSQRFLSEKFRWSKKAVTSFLDQLEAHGVIKVSVAQTGTGTKSKRTQITLCNYEKYQSFGTKTEPRGDQKGAKEEQVTNIPPTEGAAAPSNSVVDLSSPTAAVWAVGKAYLAKHQVKNPGALIGGWLKNGTTAVDVLAAIQAADRAGTQDPVPYITEALKPKAQRRFAKHDGPQIGEVREYGNGVRKQYSGVGVGWIPIHA